jgi:hypothetical protein
LIVSMELQQPRSAIDPELSRSAFFDQLANVNQDFREAKRMQGGDTRAILELHEFGKGPFADADVRIKAKYFY